MRRYSDSSTAIQPGQNETDLPELDVIPANRCCATEEMLVNVKRRAEGAARSGRRRRDSSIIESATCGAGVPSGPLSVQTGSEISGSKNIRQTLRRRSQMERRSPSEAEPRLTVTFGD